MEKDAIVVLIVVALFVAAILKIRSAQKDIEASNDRKKNNDAAE